jgi:hypothetical protein
MDSTITTQRQLMNLLLAIFLIVFEAVFEGLKTGGHHIASEMVEAVYLSGVTFGLFAWLNWKQVNSFFDRQSIVRVLIGYVLLRFALFDLVWNISADQDLLYYGITKAYDIFMSKLGGWCWFLKIVAGIWGVAWLMGWQDGIKKTKS